MGFELVEGDIRITDHSQAILQTLKSQFDEGRNCDLIIRVKNEHNVRKSFRVHSLVFKTFFPKVTGDSVSLVASFQGVKALLNLIYAGNIEAKDVDIKGFVKAFKQLSEDSNNEGTPTQAVFQQPDLEDGQKKASSGEISDDEISIVESPHSSTLAPNKNQLINPRTGRFERRPVPPTTETRLSYQKPFQPPVSTMQVGTTSQRPILPQFHQTPLRAPNFSPQQSNVQRQLQLPTTPLPLSHQINQRTPLSNNINNQSPPLVIVQQQPPALQGQSQVSPMPPLPYTQEISQTATNAALNLLPKAPVSKEDLIKNPPNKRFKQMMSKNYEESNQVQSKTDADLEILSPFKKSKKMPRPGLINKRSSTKIGNMTRKSGQPLKYHSVNSGHSEKIQRNRKTSTSDEEDNNNIGDLRDGSAERVKTKRGIIIYQKDNSGKLIKRFPCAYCNPEITFQQKSALRTHQLSIHPNEAMSWQTAKANGGPKDASKSPLKSLEGEGKRIESTSQREENPEGEKVEQKFSDLRNLTEKETEWKKIGNFKKLMVPCVQCSPWKWYFGKDNFDVHMEKSHAKMKIPWPENRMETAPS